MKKRNPRDIILSAFESGIVLTVKQAWRMAGTTELRRIVSRLKRQGYDIRTFTKTGENFNHYYLFGALPAKGTRIESYQNQKLPI